MEDSRLQLVITDEGAEYRRFNVDVVDAREMARRIAMALRHMELTATLPFGSFVESLQFFAWETERKICAVIHPETKQLRISVSGMTSWEACILCDNAADYFAGIVNGVLA